MIELSVLIAVFFMRIGYRWYVTRRAMSIEGDKVYTMLTDGMHFGIGYFAASLAKQQIIVGPCVTSYAGVLLTWLISLLYLAYQIADYIRNKDTIEKDIAAYVSGLLFGLGLKV